MESEWQAEEVTLDTVDWQGKPLRLAGVPGERNRRTKSLRFDPAAVARASMEDLSRRIGLEGQDLPLLLMLHAEAGHFRGGVSYNKYSLNKMLFYQWKRLGQIGLGEAYVHDTFASARAGPIPVELKADLERLASAGILQVDWSRNVTTPTVVRLTPKGEDMAKRLWNATPPVFREATLRVKGELLPLSPESLKAKVHAEFPEFKKTYVEEDRE